MSYVSGNQRSLLVAAAASTASGAVVGTLSPGYCPMVLRAVALVFTTAAGAEGVLEINHRPTAGSASGETVVDTMTFDATLGAAGKVVYLDGLNQKVLPGESVAFEITDVAASGVCDIWALIEESWEQPANNTDMTATV